MRLYLAGHGHTLEASPRFAKYLRKQKANFLVSFAVKEMKRMIWIKESNDAEKKGKKQ